jgi:glycosyltransferase involved in cell wall biosynthesis
MKILFMHPNMPGQYKYLCPEFAKDPANQVVFITKNKAAALPNVHKILYEVPRQPSPHCHRYMVHAEQAIIQGQEVWRSLNRLKHEEGFVPDIICAHPGWGDALYVKDVYPDTPLLSFFEFYYHSKGADVGFDPADMPGADDMARVRTKNMHHLLNLSIADWGISPTFWQHSLHPAEYQPKISVIHDGINCDAARPAEQATIHVTDKLTLKKGDEIVTYIARNFEPYRGFTTFMKAAEIILKKRPNCHIIAIGADDVSYGRRPPKGTTYRQMMMKEVNLDLNRIHFVGTQSYDNLVRILQASAAHIYLTYPFVLSWSCMESMAIGCAVVGSDTQPVREVIKHGETGFLVDFFSPQAVADQVFEILDHPTRMQHVRDAARQSMLDKYDLKKLLPLHMQLVRDVADRKLPPPAHASIQSLYEVKKAA